MHDKKALELLAKEETAIVVRGGEPSIRLEISLSDLFLLMEALGVGVDQKIIQQFPNLTFAKRS